MGSLLLAKATLGPFAPNQGHDTVTDVSANASNSIRFLWVSCCPVGNEIVAAESELVIHPDENEGNARSVPHALRNGPFRIVEANLNTTYRP